jgi:hypothetical protein
MRAIVLAVLVMLGALHPASAAKLALVIGNSSYAHTNPLTTPEIDAGAFAAFLETAGFSVTTLMNATRPKMEEALADFAAALQPEDTAVFYYAGHGVQEAGENFLVGVDARFRKPEDVADESLDLGAVLTSVEVKAGIAMIFIDACRSNPLAAALQDAQPGLAPIEPQDDGTMIALAAAPGRIAFDGGGEHSPFTAALLDHLGDPGVEVGAAFRRVIRDVRDLTNNHQLPQIVSSLSDEYFFGPSAAPDTGTVEDAERDFERVKRLDTIRGWHLYLDKYPEGEFSDMARAELQKRLGTLWNTEEGTEPAEVETSIAFSRQGKLEVQVALADLGYDLGTPDGLFGPKSRGAIADFQRTSGITETGYLSFSTLAQLGIPFVDSRASPTISGPGKVYAVADIEGIETDERLVNAIRCFGGRKIVYGFYGGHLYVAVPGGNGMSMCGGHLATIATAEENSFIFNMIRVEPGLFEYGSEPDGLSWISGPKFGYSQGGGAREPTGGWQWVTGEPVTFTNWGQYQPDDHENRQDIAHFQVFSRSGPASLNQSTWDDASDIGDIIVEFE